MKQGRATISSLDDFLRGGGNHPSGVAIFPFQSRPTEPEGPPALNPSVKDKILLPGTIGTIPADCGRKVTPGFPRGGHFISFSTKITTTTARIRRMIKPPYIKKFINFFPKLIFSFVFSGVAVSCTGLLVASMALLLFL
jgi:hypothetical protein